ncbi:hydrogenase/urease accessory protein HupE [Neobacillus niacini]|uniref:HupE/UreJ family protein n=1 Tax=Neobacillus driksii TaxID=3035913 RepID=UPI002787CF9D|nr:HupE/UreJ family protein [Neobacillus niacini]MDQ0975090.1 hydrogenase/urease accessory protein HupE [Neobacillus niacini]
MISCFDKKRQVLKFHFKPNRLLNYLAILTMILMLFPSSAHAHAYSASYTTIKMDQDKTEFIFSIDSLSIIELIEGIDKNKNNELEKSEVKEGNHELEELVHHHLTLDLNNRQQEPALEKMVLEKKEDKNFLSYHLTFPAFSAGDTLSLNDGLYVNDPDTNYVNLISFEFAGTTGQAILQGKERTWTILLAEAQEEQLEDGQTAQPEENQPQQEQSEATPQVETSNSSSWFSFFKLGMLHILTGYDHLLFLLALLLRKQTFKQYAAIITSFTIAHSITISLAVLGIITLPSRFVESIIAFSIVYVALENIFRKEIRHRWGLTFLFGLIHGLGFANILREMNIPKSDLAVALVNFNIGIEVVQLALVLLVLPLLTYMFKLKSSKIIIKIGSTIVAALGAFWLIERLFS